MADYFSRDELKINKEELKKAKNIILSKSKLNISPQFLSKYDDLDEIFRNKMKNLSNTLKSNVEKNSEKQLKNEIIEQNLINNITNDGKNKDENIKESQKPVLLGDIISRKNLLNLKSQIIKDNLGYDDKRLPLNDKNKNSFNFRSKYEDQKNTIENLSVILSLPMNSDRINLINYYKQSKDISPFYFENLAKYNEAQIFKLNKICQMVFHKKEEEMKESKISKEKKLNKDKIMRQRGNIYLNYIGKIMNKTNGIISEYNLRKEIFNSKKKKIYRDEIKKIKKNYWDKYGVNDFYKEKKTLGQNNLNSSEVEELHNKKNLHANKSSPNIFS
jgi:hypothetical protein